MLSYRHSVLRLSLGLGYPVVVALCLLAAALLSRFASLGAAVRAEDLYLSAGVAGAVSGWTLMLCGAHELRPLPKLRSELGSIAGGWALGFVAIFAVGPALGLAMLSLPTAAFYAPLSLAALVAFRASATRWLQRSRAFQRPTFLVVGSDFRARLVASQLEKSWGSRNLGFLDDDRSFWMSRRWVAGTWAAPRSSRACFSMRLSI